MSYTGFGVYQPPPPPRKPNRAPLWVALGVVGVLAAGGAVALVAVDSGDEPAAPSSSAPAAPPWQVVEDSRSGVVYELPPDWESQGGGASGRIALGSSYVSRPFECQGRNMIQAQAVAGSLVEDDPEQVGTELVNRLAASGYTVNGAPPTIGDPRVEGDGDRVVVSVEVTPEAANACFAPKARITAVALRDGGEVAVFALNVAEGGPHVAEGPSEDDVERILGSVRLP
ncbi:hypothetical protein [Saccharothrix longispora]|uniref:hypothetical protein n=1 Tax=Saccharothrix longispora TaxID=33920 RepID=UPI0028FD1566|nr:hypothetical protein [Saccharothrix longispora]MDU0293362.1 hypothetical protein [Saccharothrix longispora]